MIYFHSLNPLLVEITILSDIISFHNFFLLITTYYTNIAITNRKHFAFNLFTHTGIGLLN